jgi:hypothetical protein
VLARWNRRGTRSALTTGPDDVSARLQVVRELNADDGEEDVVIEADGQIEDLSRQHRLLGWHVERSVLEFLNEVRADLDVDEYGYPVTRARQPARASRWGQNVLAEMPDRLSCPR